MTNCLLTGARFPPAGGASFIANKKVGSEPKLAAAALDSRRHQRSKLQFQSNLDLPGGICKVAVGAAGYTERSAVAQAGCSVGAILQIAGGIGNGATLRNDVPRGAYPRNVIVVEEVESFAQHLEVEFFGNGNALGDPQIQILNARLPEGVTSRDVNAEGAIRAVY